MILINLDSLDVVTQLTRACEKYEIDTDVVYGRYVVNGKSVLGVSSLIGKIVKIEPNTDDNLLLEYLTRDLKEIGAWTEEKTN